jgi:hypothetical protein
MNSVTIKCNEFADMMKEIINLLAEDNSSAILRVLSKISNVIVCSDIKYTDTLFSEFSNDYKTEMKRLITECKDSICSNGDSKMTITCETIRIFLNEDEENAYDEMKKECQKMREQLDVDEDIVDIIFSLIGKEPYVDIPENVVDQMMNKNLPDSESLTQNISKSLLGSVTVDNIDDIDLSDVMNQFNQKDILDKLKNIDKEKLTPIKQLLGLMMKCSCDIDNESSPNNKLSPEKKGLSTTVIIIIVVSVLLLLFLGMFFLYSRRK